MDSHPSDSSAPRLRGLDPARLLGLLNDDTNESPPQISGWHISGVAGQGGSGLVWRAVREADGVVAAIKIASPSEPDTVERIEHEAGFLRSLRHPNIVGLLESGPLLEGSDEGGLYLAMEYIDGPALVHEIPEEGLPPLVAFGWFREIADAVAHAHDGGILHRDLKPGNVLMAPDGRAMVADFGLGLPVHRRVHQLTLTRAGLVAGTAEYLPPEAYRRDYKPAPTADIFALGVMLHEMLTGTPPRGAWQPASSRKGVDVRIDEIIRRAMEPDPERRWQDVRAMVTRLNTVIASPPRYSGTPQVTSAVRATDCLWTLLGLFLFIAGTSSLMTLDKAWISLPFDLIGNHGRLIGSFHALFIMTAMAVPLGLWQTIRLRRFRHIPMREALPSPFGLRLGHSHTAAFLIFLCQVLCVFMPVMSMLTLYGESSLVWIRSDDPPWTHGLVVTTLEGRSPISPWKLPEYARSYLLWESDGPPENALSKTLERISFVPFFTPLIMITGGILAACALLITAITAFRIWWCRSRRCVAVLSVCPLLVLSVALRNIHEQQSDSILEMRKTDREDRIVDEHMTQHLKALVGNLMGANPGKPVFGTHGEYLDLYADTVDYRKHGMIPRKDVPKLHHDGITRARAVHIMTHGFFPEWQPSGSWFDLDAKGLEYYDGHADGGGSGANLISLKLAGNVTTSGSTAIQREILWRDMLWRADDIVIRPHEAVEWAHALDRAAEAVARDPLSAAAILEPLFNPLSAEPEVHRPAREWYQPGPAHDGRAIRAIMEGTLDLRPAGTTLERTLPGGRSLISIPLQTGLSRTLQAHLIHTDGNWRCVKLAF